MDKNRIDGTSYRRPQNVSPIISTRKDNLLGCYRSNEWKMPKNLHEICKYAYSFARACAYMNKRREYVDR